MSESSGVDAAFDRSRERFESVVGFLPGSQAAGLTHSELETRLSIDARELIRVLYQDLRRSFFAEGDPAAEEWVAEKALAVLRGQASTVAAAIRRKATCLGPVSYTHLTLPTKRIV